MKRLTLPEGKELCDFLNEEDVAPFEIEEGKVEIEGFVLALEEHPADQMLNAWQLFRKDGKKVDDDPSALWECDEWI